MDGLRSGSIPGLDQAGAAPGASLRRKQVKAYDFRRPEKFSRDQLRTIRGIHEQLVRLLNSSLAAYLRTTVETSLESVEQQAYHEFTAQTHEGNLIYVINLDPLPVPMLGMSAWVGCSATAGRNCYRCSRTQRGRRQRASVPHVAVEPTTA